MASETAAQVKPGIFARFIAWLRSLLVDPETQHEIQKGAEEVKPAAPASPTPEGISNGQGTKA